MQLKPNNIVQLSDEFTLNQLLACKKISKYDEITITSVTNMNVTAVDGLSYQLAETDRQNVYIVIKKYKDTYDFRLYRDTFDEPIGNRRDFIDADMLWLFAPPESDEWSSSDLEFSKTLIHDDNQYVEKNPSLFAETVEANEDDVKFVTVHEWIAQEKVDYPEIILFEITDDPEALEGGLISLFVGRSIPIDDVKVY